jgi:hypothetical protein
MFKNHYSLAFHGIIGIVLASTAVIVPLKYTSSRNLSSAYYPPPPFLHNIHNGQKIGGEGMTI